MKHPHNLQDLLSSLLPLLQVHFGIVLEDWSTSLVLVVNINSIFWGVRAKERGDRFFHTMRDACFKLDRG